MTARDDFDRQLIDLLAAQAPTREPEQLLGQVLARTSGTRRRAAWLIPERWLPMSAITSRLSPAGQVPMRGLALALVLLAVLVAGLVAVAGNYHPRPQPFGPAGNGKVFYSNGGDILARAAGAGTAARIVTGSDQDTDPVLSPDGSSFSFLRHTPGHVTQIWTANVDGSDLRRLATPDAEPGWFEWSPQGDMAVFASDSDPNAITLVPARGSKSTRFDLGVRSENVVFRPVNGSQLAILGTDQKGDRGIWLVNRDGTDLHRLDLDPGFRTDAEYTTNRDYYFWTMSWSPTGDRLLYTQLEPAPDSPAGPGFRTHLATIDAAGTVTSDRVLEFSASADDELGAVWFPSGDRLAFETRDGSRQWVSTASLAGSTVSLAQEQPLSGAGWIGLQVSPDGSKLLAVMPSVGGQPSVVQVLDLATGSLTSVDVGADASWQRIAP